MSFIPLLAEGDGAGWITGAVGLLIAVGSIAMQLIRGTKEVRRDEVNNLLDQQRKTIDRQGEEVKEVRGEMRELIKQHAQDSEEKETEHRKCVEDRARQAETMAWQSERILSLEEALQNRKIPFRRVAGPPPPVGPGSGRHTPLSPDLDVDPPKEDGT